MCAPLLGLIGVQDFSQLTWETPGGAIVAYGTFSVSFASAVLYLIQPEGGRHRLPRPELLDVRPGWGGGKLNATTLALQPLSDEQTARLIGQRIGGPTLAESQAHYRNLVELAHGYFAFRVRIDGDRIGLIGMSHGGEMVLKITSEYQGIKAAVASEPAAHEFLALTPDETAFVEPDTGMRNIEEMAKRLEEPY